MTSPSQSEPSPTVSECSNSRSASTKKSCRFSPTLPGLIIDSPTQSHYPTPPLTPLTPLTPCLKINSRNNSYFYEGKDEFLGPSPKSVKGFKALATHTPDSIPITQPTPFDEAHYLHAPLTAHLALLHPSTPVEVIHFCATRLLSPDTPHGFDSDLPGASTADQIHQGSTEEGQWTPVWRDMGDLATAGLGLEASKSCQQVGPGKEIDERLEWMYSVARRSWVLLEMKGPAGGDRL